MLSTMNRKVLFSLVFSFLFTALTYSQSLGNVLGIANDQYRNGNYPLALKEYQRFLFFNDSTPPSVLYQIAECFFKLNQYENAYEFYDKAFFSFQNDSLRLDALFKKIECLLRNGDYSLGLNDILGISDTVSGQFYYKKEFFAGISYFGMEDFQNAEYSFLNCIEPQYTKQKDQLKSIFQNKRNFEKPNPKTAYILSLCFPGLGQFYSGDIKNGLNSVGLTAALVYLAVRIAYSQTLLDALVTIAPWYQRYYQGGYESAERIAAEKKLHKRGVVYGKIIDIIAETKK